MFAGAIECLDDKNSVKQAEKCIEESGKPLHAAMNIVQNEINTFQVRFEITDDILTNERL